MKPTQIVSREEWERARESLLAQEKAMSNALSELTAERSRLPVVAVEKEYRFEGSEGTVTLLDLFDGREQLIVYHFMFDPDWDEGCVGCSFVVDNLGHLSHLQAANTSLAVVSRAPLEKLQAFKRRMDWSFRWVSSYGTDFNPDFKATSEHGEEHGVSVFIRNGESIYHSYSTYNRGVELLLTTFNYLDLTPLGRQEESGIMNWVRHHDRYALSNSDQAVTN
jgi:predicted dithiol-disulfide oxidoreductase (DUF899 family)